MPHRSPTLLLLVPLALITGALLFTYSQTTNEQQAEHLAQSDPELILQTYLDQMSDLVTDKKLRESQSNSEVRDSARTITLSALKRLDGDRKATILQFLHDSELIQKTNLIITLHGADLSDIKLASAGLIDTYLPSADLRRADLGGAYLPYANLPYADLTSANLAATNLAATNFIYANFSGADLSGANFSGADLRSCLRMLFLT